MMFFCRWLKHGDNRMTFDENYDWWLVNPSIKVETRTGNLSIKVDKWTMNRQPIWTKVKVEQAIHWRTWVPKVKVQVAIKKPWPKNSLYIVYDYQTNKNSQPWNTDKVFFLQPSATVSQAVTLDHCPSFCGHLFIPKTPWLVDDIYKLYLKSCCNISFPPHM